MDKATQAIKITILGKEYRVNVSSENHDTLMEVREYLDRRMHDSKKQYHLTSTENVAVMTALNLANEVISQKKILDDREKRLQKLSKTLDGLI